MDEEEFENLIADALGIEAFSYNSEVTENVWSVLSLIHDKHPVYVTEIAEKVGLSESHVELIQYLICNNDHAEYGTSPRGCWLTDKGNALYNRLVELRNESHTPKPC